MLSIDKPSNSQFMLLNNSARFAKPMNSVVHTGVKSAGCENKMSHLPLKSAKLRGPWVVLALNAGAASLMRGMDMVRFL
jgi:hypothetical protein